MEELDGDGEVSKYWSFDHVFGDHCDNQFIFNTLGAKLVDGAMDGFNTVLFMYGQTSSGMKIAFPFVALCLLSASDEQGKHLPYLAVGQLLDWYILQWTTCTIE